MRALSITQAWNEAVAVLRREGSLILPVALAFIALPLILFQLVAPQQTAGMQPEPGAWMIWIIPLGLATMLGTLSITLLALRGGISVGEALAEALRRIPRLIAATLVVVILVMFILVGTMVIVVGGMVASGGAEAAATMLTLLILMPVMLFFWTRFMLMTPVAAAEAVGTSQIIRRSWMLTKGHSWRLLGFALLVSIGFAIVSLAVTMVLGSIVSLLLGTPEPGNLSFVILLLVGGALNALFGGFYAVLVARIYAQLSAAPTSGI